MRYFIYADNRQQGPFSVSELMERGLSSETLVWAEGMEQWTPAWQGGGSGTSGRADAAEEIIYEPRRRHIGGRVAGIVVAVVIAFALTVTCPTREQHCEAVAGEISAAISQSNGASGFWGMFSNIFASGVVNMAVNQFLDVDNYYLFSIGTINIEGKSRAVSFGILNHVFTFDNDYIREALNEERMAE